MGLTIHYSLKTRGGHPRAQRLVNALHQAALNLPFTEVGEVMELSGDECDLAHRKQDDPLRWLVIQAGRDVEISSQRRVHGGRTYRTYQPVSPIRLIGFTAWPGEGCEESNFGLCQYPAVIAGAAGPLKTKLSGWRWSSFCKTQYASDPRCGGVPNFLQCHLTVVALLDTARRLGCLAEVSDEGEFWEKRDLPALVEQIGSWNEMLAALGGKLKDLLGDGPSGLQSAICDFPNFEQLEAAGQGKLPAGYEKLTRLIQCVMQEARGREIVPTIEVGDGGSPADDSDQNSGPPLAGPILPG